MFEWFRRSKAPKNDEVNQKEIDNSNKICIDCDKKTQQKDIPDKEETSAPGMPCAESYQEVSQCMTKHNGQVSACAQQWKIFKDCHAAQKQQHL